MTSASPFKSVGTSSKAKIFVAAAACSDVSPTGTSVAEASPSRAKPSRIAAGILLSTAMPRETAITGRPCSLAMRLKCAAAIWLLTEPWRHTNTNVAGLLESSSARLVAPIEIVVRRSIKVPTCASEQDLGDGWSSMRFGSTAPPEPRSYSLSTRWGEVPLRIRGRQKGRATRYRMFELRVDLMQWPDVVANPCRGPDFAGCSAAPPGVFMTCGQASWRPYAPADEPRLLSPRRPRRAW